MKVKSALSLFTVAVVLSLLPLSLATAGTGLQLLRPEPTKPVYQTLPQHENTNEIVFKLSEGMGQPVLTVSGSKDRPPSGTNSTRPFCPTPRQPSANHTF